MKKRTLKFIARVLILSFAYQLVLPVCSYALTTGPTQPEVQSFEPVGTTEMVDMFTGDFTYNLPLMDVEGYPINMYYHSGIGVEQEASWVGLGWNINPGEINRAVRGLPDDFNGETIDKELYIKPEENFKVGTGVTVSLEIGGFDASKYGVNLNVGLSNYIAYNNYKGLSIGGSTGATVSTPFASAGINMGMGSQEGADIDVNASLRLEQSVTQDVGAGMSVSGSTGFNTRSGLKGISWGVSLNTFANVKTTEKTTTTDAKTGVSTTTEKTSYGRVGANNASFSTTVPIGLQNYVPVVTNPSVLKSFEFQTRFGGELYYTYPNAHFNIQKSTLEYEKDGSRAGYGYMYAENAPIDAIMDFSRDKDGYYNPTLRNLPLASMTYDVFSISGQGTGGVFRPFRNDIGSVFDPLVKSPKSHQTSTLLEGGIGNLFEVGTDVVFFDNESNSGPWNRLKFRGNVAGSDFEKIFYKQAGELTFNNQQVGGIYDEKPVYLAENMSELLSHGKASQGWLPAKFGDAHIYWKDNKMDRTSRANLLTFLTAEEASIPDIAQYDKIVHYEKYGAAGASTDFYQPNLNNAIPQSRYSESPDKAKKHHVSEYTQTTTDGRRYVYGLPAMNNMSREVTMSVRESDADINTGLVSFSPGNQDKAQNGIGKEEFYSSTTTPAYAHSYLLSSVLSSDYVDVLGDGPTDDDMGGWVKFNYTLWDDDYRWRAPWHGDKAQYNAGFTSDRDDDKGNYIIGSRQQWHVRSIESKNYVAEFYVSKRDDGLGVKKAVLGSGTKFTSCQSLKQDKTDESYSYKLDSIKLYNKHDRYINGNSATPIKTVVFKYSYNLCKGIPNKVATAGDIGKLTLEKVYTRYGSSDKNLLSPYEFSYSNQTSSDDHKYNFANKDRWGNFKVNNSALTNYEFPYVKQDGTNLDADAAPWELTDIKLPSGGKIKIKYESDDYSFVQNKRSMQMVKIVGIGNSNVLDYKSNLYEDVNTVNEYIYFERMSDKENPNLSLKDNYLEGEDKIYYSFNIDLTGTERYEHVKGYAMIEQVGACTDPKFGYIKIKRINPGGEGNYLLHPATVYALNIGRYYIPHVLYPGFDANGGMMDIYHGLRAAKDELLSIKKNPIARFVGQDKAKNIKLDKSWVRLCRPGLTKKGGGLRVKELTINDEWNNLSGSSENASFGKKYEYTTDDDRYGKGISSGVASYEPSIGGDENPFKQPVHYLAEANYKMPPIVFFQEEPFGEGFFPSPVVGYSKVTVKSIHIDNARSSQSVEEHSYYTAKEFPIEVEFTGKDAPTPEKTKNLRKKSEHVKVFQGYALRFNDMHGKPKEVKNYEIKSDGTNITWEPVSRVTYNYNRDNNGKLDNNVLAVVRERGTKNNYKVQYVKLGEEVDFTVDTRERYNRAYRRSVDISCNTVLIGVFPIPVPTSFFPDREEVMTFHSMVTTKIIQKYGILKSVEYFDNGATNIVENVLYDSETGAVLLKKSNTQYDGEVFDLEYPAYWAHERMGPAYTNIGYEEKADSLIIENRSDNTVSCSNAPTFHGRLYLPKDKFFPGDELLLTYKGTDNQTHKIKVWVLDEFPSINYCPTLPYAYSVPMEHAQAHKYRRVALRYSRNGTFGTWPGIYEGVKTTEVYAKVIRSGRRNNLSQVVQTVRLTDKPFDGNNLNNAISDILGGSSAFDKVLSINVTQFTDMATPYGHAYGDSIMLNGNGHDYDPEVFPTNITTTGKSDYNRFVLGHRGNFRPQAEYSYIAKRDYSANNVKVDGKFAAKSFLFWKNINNSSGERAIIEPSNYSNNTNYWKCNRYVLRYDVFGNALEELDATGKYVAAQYGYNKSLPTAVASNAKHRSFFFDGFEDYRMLVPKHLYGLYNGTYNGTWFYHTPFMQKYHDVDVNNTTDNYGQSYYKGYKLLNNGDNITDAASHTGNYSIKFSNARTFVIKTKNRTTEAYGQSPMNLGIKQFTFDSTRKYVISMWLKPAMTSVTPAYALASIGIATNLTSTSFPFKFKTGNIDGWYQAEYMIDLRFGQPQQISLTLPANVYFDDFRIIPVDGNMKSFVYDPISYKLTAQLDENNFATYYEYDQEGLLVRVKKETEKGVLTISESRRANSKKQ